MQGSVVVSTSAGALRGVRSAGVDSFLGVPYGAPPVGARRLRESVPAEPWRGVRDATSFGAAAAQVDPRLDSQGTWAQVLELMYPRGGTPVEAGRMSEDCLFLNVWSPSGAEPGSLPVMVWFHGGGFVHGAGSEAMFHGTNLARTGRAVIVTVNHRLGMLGYLPLGHLLGEDYALSGLAGMTDLVLALRWVRDNIAAFGGDAGNVTIFGQSGGGAKVSTLMSMPPARGLFHKAVLQSGVMGVIPSRDEGEDLAAAVLDSFGISETHAELLLDLPLAVILEGQRRFTRAITTFRPSAHPEYLPGSAFGAGGAPLDPEVPVMVGITSHDMALMLTEDPEYAGLTEDSFARRLDELYGEEGPAILREYRDRQPDESPQLVLSRIYTDRTFGLAAGLAADHLLALGHEVYKYEFAYETDAHQGLLGACHSLDLPFVFNTVQQSPFAGDKPDRYAVAAAMSSAWLDFAESGVPRTPAGEPWVRYDASRPVTVIDTEWSQKNEVDPEKFRSTAHAPMWTDDGAEEEVFTS